MSVTKRLLDDLILYGSVEEIEAATGWSKEEIEEIKKLYCE